MKKIFMSSFTLILAFLMVFSILPLKAQAAGFVMKLDSYGEWTVTGYSGSGDVYIPAYLKYNSVDYPVTTIAGSAFAGCTGVTSVHCPETMKYIGDLAFSGCTALTLVDIGQASNSNSAFDGCTSLQEVKVAANNPYYRNVDGILYSKDYPFIELYPKSRQGRYDIPDNVTCINEAAFKDCVGLTEVSIPDGVLAVGADAFKGCKNLSSAFFKGNAPYMYNAAFDGCKPGFVIRYISGKYGFTNPWYGYTTEAVTETFTVAFDLNGAAGTPPAAQKLNKNELAAKPADPVWEGYAFGGWYRDKACTAAWDFSTPVTESITLYAKWNALSITPSANLAGITVSAGSLSPAFQPNVLKYTLNLGENDKSVKVTPVKAYSGASVTIDGKKAAGKTVSVANGKSVPMTIKVKNGKTVKTYVLTIKRAKSKNNLLSSLKVSAGTLSPAFSPSSTAYTLVLQKGKNKVTITAKAASSLATVTPAKKAYTLKAGKTLTVTIKVKAQSGTTATYKITIS